MHLSNMFYATVKADKVDELRAMLVKAAEATRAEEEGCITFVLHQQVQNPHAFVVYEQWRDQDALNANIAHLQRLFGPPAPGGR